jgi:hypothetical protein
LFAHIAIKQYKHGIVNRKNLYRHLDICVRPLSHPSIPPWNINNGVCDALVILGEKSWAHWIQLINVWWFDIFAWHLFLIYRLFGTPIRNARTFPYKYVYYVSVCTTYMRMLSKYIVYVNLGLLNVNYGIYFFNCVHPSRNLNTFSKYKWVLWDIVEYKAST